MDDDDDCFALSNEISVADDDDASFAGLAFVDGSFSGVLVNVGIFRGDFFPPPQLPGSIPHLYWGWPQFLLWRFCF